MHPDSAALHSISDPVAAAPFPSPASGAAIGSVQALSLRPAPGRPPVDARQVRAEAGLGLAGDAHADPLSPRQLLLAGTPAYTQYRLPARALRENLLLDVDTARLASGMLLRVGPEAVLWLTFQCEACGYLDVRRPGIARAIGRERGMLARVLRGGAIGVGDAIVPLADAAGTWPDDWRERVAAILARVPEGMVVEYRQLARLAGVQPVYCRTFPRLARSLGFGHVAVPIGGRPAMPRWTGATLFDVTAPRPPSLC